MKHNLLKSVIISVILLMGVSNAWAASTVQGGYIYFDELNSGYTGAGDMQFWVGHNSYSSSYSMSKITNTKLWYCEAPSWGDATYFAFTSSANWGAAGQKYYDRIGSNPWKSATKEGYTLNSGQYYVFKVASTANKAAVNTDSPYGHQGSAYSSLNKTITIKAKISTNGGSSYQEANTPAKLTGSSKVFTSQNSCASTSGASATLNAGSSYTTFKAGYTANTTLTAVAATGYTFAGWYTDSKVSSDLKPTVNPAGETTYYAYYKAHQYTVKFDANGGTTGSMSNQSHTYGVSKALTENAFTKTGYNFAGWNTKADGTGTSYTDKQSVSNLSSTDGGSVTLYAQWELATYTITYDNLKGATHTNPATYTINSATITFTAPTSKPAGYTFANWSPASIAAGSTGNKTVTANWTAATSTVELNQEEATEKGTASVTATYGSAMPTITKLPIRTGYTFGGYYTGKNGAGTQYYKADGTSATTWNLEGAQTLYAKWTPITYSVKFNGNGSTSGSMSNQSFTYDEAAKALTTNAFKKTGYTFAGWNTAANGSGTSYADKATVRNLTTSNNATINLYAKWTINQYTLTYSAGEGGSVTGPHESGTKYDYNTSITLTATPTAGNVFVQWVNESGTMVSTANPYTFNLTANKTVKAEFAPPTTVYLKPVDWWPNDDARFAIYTWGAAGKTDRWVEMQPVDCENQYYSANIPSGYTNFKYIRLNPRGKDDASKNDGLHWDYKWGETGDLTLQGEDKNLYTTPRIYLKPNANWKADGARFAAYFFKKDGETTHEYWMSMYKDGDYYYCNIPTNNPSYDQVIFCRMNPSEAEDKWDNKWDQTNDLKLPTTGDNLYTVAEGAWSNGSGSWSTHFETFAPTYTVTLNSSSYGLYNVSINGQTHHSNYKTDVVVENVPLGAQVEVYNIMPHNPEVYNEDIIVKRSSNANYERYTNNKTFTVCGNTTIAEDFVTKEAHTLYLGVPDALITATTQWNLQKFIWTKNGSGDQPLIESTQSFKIGTVTYYEITIPAGYNKFCFQSKQQAGSGPTECQSIWFYRSIPTNNVNCFTLKNEKDGSGYYKGDWSQLPAAEGDFRVLYVEQEVAHGTGADDWKTVINTTYQHSSDIIKKRTATGTDIVSLHINYDETKHPRIILQQMSSGEWVDVEGQARMAVGPLTATADKAMAPGRRNAAGEGLLTYDDGIEEIKQDKQNGYAGGVWNFTVQQTVDNGNVTAKLLLEELEPYTGEYYIRTDNAEGGWLCYNQPNNVMPYSEYSLIHSGYSHYFCKWVETSNKPNTKFVVANEYGAAISDTLSGEFDENGNLLSFIDEHGNLTEKANVRWMWNKYTNKVSRAYIAGSTEPNFLVAKYAASSTKTFADKGEWVYEADLTDVKIDDKLTSIAATYATQVQQLLEKSHADAGGLIMLASAGNDDDANESSYTVRIVYDFKINKTIVYLIPTENVVATSIDVLIERINQDEAGKATQVTAAITSANDEGLTVYGLITLTKNHITDPHKSEQEALTYWISFPFDVKIGDITGFGEVGKHWMIKYYDGAERAAKGWFLDTKTFWKFFLDTEDVMKANTGYVLTLNKSLLNKSNPVYDNTETLRLYFPSIEKIKGEIISVLTTTTVDVPEHWCNITSPANRKTKDSHWNMIGVPSFANKTITTTNTTVKYFYDYSHKNDTYQTAQNIGAKTFKPMHAYMVQFAGVIDWNSQEVFNGAQQQLAAKKNADAEEQYTLRLELQQNGTKSDQTFVELHDDATTMFDMNVDLTKMFNTGANIYTLIGSETEVAANVMPIANTVIPVGVQIAKAGEYTFAMPDGTDGITVELIDYETNTRTNLLLSEYTVDLNAGTFETRFALHVKPSNVTTSIDPVLGENGQVRKILMNGQLYLLKDGQLYDAQGRCVH